MEQMRRELERFQSQPLRSHTGSPGWAAGFQPPSDDLARMEAAFHGPRDAPGSFSPADFARYQQSSRTDHERIVSANGLQQTPNTLQRPYQDSSFRGYGGMGGIGMGMGMGVGVSRLNNHYSPFSVSQQPAVNSKGKGRMVELDDENWEAQFASVAASDPTMLDVDANIAMERELNDMDSQFASTESASAWKDELALSDVNEWTDFDSSFSNPTLFSRDPQLGDYLFEESNIFNSHPSAYDEGLRIISEGGNLSLAALAFEAAVQHDPSHVLAWSSLGNAQAQNEKETPAIRALEQALRLDPTNLSALMGLAVSYTNEGYDSTAYRTLERWLGTKYPQLVDLENLTRDADIGFTDRAQLHEKVTNLFIRAAQLSPDGEHMDPDVQVGLGVLFYGAEAYDKAVDCFSAALASTESGSSNERSQLHLLWNRLGATLANSGRSEEAIAAYEKALTLRPNFVRARYNLGVSCINIGCYEEAAQHLLGALAMHDVVAREGRERAREIAGASEQLSDRALDEMVTQNQSTNLYDTLRRVFGQMGRRDLSERVVAGLDVDTFRDEFDF